MDFHTDIRKRLKDIRDSVVRERLALTVDSGNESKTRDDNKKTKRRKKKKK